MSPKLNFCWQNLKKYLLRNEFTRNIALLMGTAGLSQVIILIFIPVLTRLYTPVDYGNFAIYSSVLSVILVVASLRFELGISLPKNDEDAIKLLVLSLFIVFATSIFTGMGLFLFNEAITNWVKIPELKHYLWILPLSVLAAGMYQVLTYWSVRKNTFSIIAKSKLSLSVAQSFTQLGLGLTKSGMIGLLIGQLVADTIGSGSLFTAVKKKDWVLIRKISFKELIHTAKRYKSFPLFATPSKLLNVVTLQIPTLSLTVLYGPESTGWFALSQRLLGAPIMLVGNSLGNVFWSEASRLIQDDPEQLETSYYKLARTLFIISLVIAIFAMGSPWIFPVVFGEHWLEAGIYTRSMCLLFITQFVVTPLSILTIHELQHWETAWNVFSLIGTATCFWSAHSFGLGHNIAILLYAIFTSIANLLLLVLNIYAIKKRNNEVSNKY